MADDLPRRSEPPPCMDGARGAREKNLTFPRSVRVQPCIRPLNAAVVAAGPDDEARCDHYACMDILLDPILWAFPKGFYGFDETFFAYSHRVSPDKEDGGRNTSLGRFAKPQKFSPHPAAGSPFHNRGETRSSISRISAPPSFVG
jgi:hypothetical protein